MQLCHRFRFVLFLNIIYYIRFLQFGAYLTPNSNRKYQFDNSYIRVRSHWLNAAPYQFGHYRNALSIPLCAYVCLFRRNKTLLVLLVYIHDTRISSLFFCWLLRTDWWLEVTICSTHCEKKHRTFNIQYTKRVQTTIKKKRKEKKTH